MIILFSRSLYARSTTDAVAAPSSAAVAVPSDDTLISASQFTLGHSAHIYALLIGLFLGVAYKLTTGNRDRIRALFRGVFDTIKHLMATVLKIPVDAREEVFPFPEGATYQL